MFHSPGRDTVSKALVRLTMRMQRSLFYFFTFLLDLSCSKYHLYSPSVLVKTTLAFWYCLVKKMGFQPVQDNLIEDLACTF